MTAIAEIRGVTGTMVETRPAMPKWDYQAQPKTRVEACNLCNCSRFVVLAHSDRYGYPVETYFCDACGLIFLNPLLSRESYAEFYASVYRPLIAYMSGKPADPAYMLAHAQWYAATLEQTVRPYVPAKANTLLDIGGSDGVVATHLARVFGLTATVVDPAVEQGEYTAVKALFEDYNPPEETQFDVITMCQTVDHLLDLRGSLQKVRRLIKPDGLFFVDIVDFLYQAKGNKKFRAVVKLDHPYNLCDYVMEGALRAAGFAWVLKTYHEDGRHVGYVCKPLSYKATGLHFDPVEVRRTLLDLRGCL